MDVKSSALPSNCVILTNSPALHSLKRQQLLRLCKRTGVKATGKNADIVKRLKAHALNMQIDSSRLSTKPVSIRNDNDKENRQTGFPRPSEQWSIIEEDSCEAERVHLGLKDIREEVEQETGTMSSFGASQISTELGRGTTSSKGSNVNLTLRTLATSLKRNKSKLSATPNPNIKLSTAPNPSMFPIPTPQLPIDDMLAVTSTPYREESHTFPLLPDPEPLNEDNSRDQSILELGASTIRLVTPAAVANSPPALRPFTPTFEPSYSPGSPSVAFIYPSLPVESDSDPSLPETFPDFNSLSAPLRTSNSPCSPAPFLFGSPVHRVSNAEFNTAAASVLAEMNARLGLTGTSNEIGLDILQNRRAAGPPAPASPLCQGNPRTDVTSRFDRAHQREFERMEGLGSWYSRRAAGSLNKPVASQKRKSDVLGELERRPLGPSNAARGRRMSRVVTPGTRHSLVSAATVEGADEKRVKRVRISVIDGVGNVQGGVDETDKDRSRIEVDEEREKASEEREKERAAIKKKLEVSRARRRSSMGRVSVGGGRPPLIPNQPKKGITTKFGFLSTAKSMVKSVWNMGVGKSAAQPPKPVLSTLSKPSGPANAAILRKPSQNVPTKVPPGATKLASFKAAAAESDSHTSLRVPSKSIGLGRKMSAHMRTDSSVGTKTSMTSSAGTRTSTVSSTTSAAPSAARRRPIPFFQQPSGRFSRTNSLVSNGTAKSRKSASGTASSLGGSIGKPGSIGIGKAVFASESRAFRNNGSLLRKQTSTLFAPTASSLARMQSTVKPQSTSAGANTIVSIDGRGLARVPEPHLPSPTGIPSCFTSSPPAEGAAVPNRGGGSIFPDGTPTFVSAAVSQLASAPIVPKPRAIPQRRPRISRSRVIAKVGAQRAASGSSLTSTTSARRSLNVSKPRGSLMARASGIGVKSRDREAVAALGARKRLRQSEILRRRSKLNGPSPDVEHLARNETPEDRDDTQANNSPIASMAG